jgi:hypothetical protein
MSPTGSPRPRSIPVAMRDPRLRGDLAELRADLRGHLSLHQLARDQHDRFTHGILKPTITDLCEDIGNRHPLIDHRGVSLIDLRKETDEHERHGGQNHQALATPLHHLYRHDPRAIRPRGEQTLALCSSKGRIRRLSDRACGCLDSGQFIAHVASDIGLPPKTLRRRDRHLKPIRACTQITRPVRSGRRSGAWNLSGRERLGAPEWGRSPRHRRRLSRSKASSDKLLS